MAVAFCGATSNGPFMDKLVDLAWCAAKAQTSIESACAAIEDSIKDTYREFGAIYQSGYCPEAELIYGVNTSGESKLFSASGPVVNEKDGYATGGCGVYMADFLSEKMYSSAMSIQQCVILAAYILFQAKEHVDGCGGRSHITILRNDAKSGPVDPQRIDSITETIQKADLALGRLLIDSSNLDLNETEFNEQITNAINILWMYRKEQGKDFESWKEFRAMIASAMGVSENVDTFGLSTPKNKNEIEDTK